MARRRRRRDKVTGKKLRQKEPSVQPAKPVDEATGLFRRCIGYTEAPSPDLSYKDRLAKEEGQGFRGKSKKSRSKRRRRLKASIRNPIRKAPEAAPEAPEAFKKVIGASARVPGAPHRVWCGGALYATLKKVYEINKSPAVFTRMGNDLARQGIQPNVKSLFHGTSASFVPNICLESLQLPYGRGMFGRGIYFAPSFIKAWGFSRAWVSSPSRFIFVAKVILGRVLVLPEGANSLGPGDLTAHESVMGKAGFTKTWSGTLNYSEYVVYDTRQVLLTHLLEYKVTEG